MALGATFYDGSAYPLGDYFLFGQRIPIKAAGVQGRKKNK
jgi:hypothetical protein